MTMCPAKTGSDRQSKSKQTDTSFLIVASVPALYQHLLTGIASYAELGSRVLRQIEAAHAFCQVEQVRDLAAILASVPIREYQLIGQYYLAWCKCRASEYQSEVLEGIAEQSHSYKAKALISRAALDVYQGNAEGALYFYAEALRVKPSISDFIKASTGIATLKSMEGFSGSALRDLEEIVPILRYAEPLTLFQALNSYAVELSEHGRLYEAHSVLAHAVASPLAPFYPELQTTVADINSKRRRHSTVTISRPQIETYEPESDLSGIMKARVEAAIEFMNENYHRKIVLDDITKAVNLASDGLIRIFKIETGFTPIDYLIRLRLEKASHLLATSFFSIKQVMAAVGYNNKGNFSRYFKRQFGITPSEYRKRFFRRR